jgi:hypothetical protein
VNRIRLILVVFAAGSVLCGCAATAPGCARDQQLTVVEHIYFGVATPDGAVTAAQWSDFLRDTVTPRFPAGLTTWEASGQWRSADGSLMREPSHVLNLVHPGDAQSEAAVLAIIDHYKSRYRQEAVLRVQASACMSL